MARVLGAADHTPNQPHTEHEHDDHEEEETEEEHAHHDHLDDFGSYHVGVTLFVRCDGSVDLIPDTIDQAVFQALSTRAGNEVTSGH